LPVCPNAASIVRSEVACSNLGYVIRKVKPEYYKLSIGEQYIRSSTPSVYENSNWIFRALSYKQFGVSTVYASAFTQQFLSCGNGAESSCCDKHELCAEWARNNECENNPDWMLPNCQLSCHNCGTESDQPSSDSSREFR
ncbi:shTK domain protein, partial [Ancylostoma caninum]